MRNFLLFFTFGALLSCAKLIPEPYPYEPSGGHINTDVVTETDDIPQLVQTAPIIPEPESPVELEKYTVVVNEVPVNELLFALARDAEINVDIDPTIEGIVTINAVDQTLPQLLDRIARQVSLRYEVQGDNLIIVSDTPFMRTYKINYLNVARQTISSITTDIGIGGSPVAGSEGGGGNNSSNTEVSSAATNYFWSNLTRNLSAILGETAGAGGDATTLEITSNVIPLPESGLLTVNATERQHQLVQSVIDKALASAERQVLIQATILEVTLNDAFQAGIDWSFLNQNNKAGFDVVSNQTSNFAAANVLSSFILRYVDPSTTRDQLLTASVTLLEEFGDVNVLSSPQLMALNNQSAVMKVVDNVVYFDIEVTTDATQGVIQTTVESNANTVPVGLVMTIMPHINENDSVILQVRPTISRILDFVTDPGVELTRLPNDTRDIPPNLVPQIQIREMESILRLNNGQIGVLGGLMQDENRSNDSATPGVSKIPLLGGVFKSRERQFSKTELVIFLRPTIVRTPSIEDDLKIYQSMLQENAQLSTGSGVN